MQAQDIVDNSEALVSALGRWPQFHDAVVRAAERRDNFQSVSIHVFNMTDRVNDQGYFELEQHHLVEIHCTGVEKNTLPSGYAGDCLDRLTFARSDGKIEAAFYSHLEADGEIVCAKAEVISVLPCTASGEVISPNYSLKR
jgi:Immunity protein 50